MRRTGIAATLVLLCGNAGFAAQEREFRLAWGDLKPLIEGQEIALTLPDSTHIQGKATAVRTDSLVVDVRKTSNTNLHPKGEAMIPRSSVFTIEAKKLRKGSTIAKFAGWVGGSVAGSAIGGAAGGLAGDIAGSAAGGELGEAAGRRLGRNSTIIWIIPVNINRASAGALERVLSLLPGEASTIVEYRMANERFRSIEDLKNVPGLDFKKIEAQKDRLSYD